MTEDYEQDALDEFEEAGRTDESVIGEPARENGDIPWIDIEVDYDTPTGLENMEGETPRPGEMPEEKGLPDEAHSVEQFEDFMYEKGYTLVEQHSEGDQLVMVYRDTTGEAPTSQTTLYFEEDGNLSELELLGVGDQPTRVTMKMDYPVRDLDDFVYADEGVTARDILAGNPQADDEMFRYNSLSPDE